jgi:hypothetical protein
MEIYTQSFVIKVGFALITSICPPNVHNKDSDKCVVASDWIDDESLSNEGMSECIAIAKSRQKLVAKGVRYTYECTPYAGGSRYGQPSETKKVPGNPSIDEVGPPIDLPDL